MHGPEAATPRVTRYSATASSVTLIAFPRAGEEVSARPTMLEEAFMAKYFSVTLTGDQEVPDTGSAAYGYGIVVWDSEAQTAAYHVNVIGIDFTNLVETGQGVEPEDASNMHVHNAPPGVSGPVVLGQFAPAGDADDLMVFENQDGSWTISGIWESTDPATVSITEFADLLDEAAVSDTVPLYFNVHSPEFPDGVIRGQWVAATAGDTTTGDGMTTTGTDAGTGPGSGTGPGTGPGMGTGTGPGTGMGSTTTGDTTDGTEDASLGDTSTEDTTDTAGVGMMAALAPQDCLFA
jgi:serralysin